MRKLIVLALFVAFALAPLGAGRAFAAETAPAMAATMAHTADCHGMTMPAKAMQMADTSAKPGHACLTACIAMAPALVPAFAVAAPAPLATQTAHARMAAWTPVSPRILTPPPLGVFHTL